jgi:hypothetical protein
MHNARVFRAVGVRINDGTFSPPAGSCNASRAPRRPLLLGPSCPQFGNTRDRTTRQQTSPLEEALMHGIIYIIGLIVVIMFILSLLGLR